MIHVVNYSLTVHEDKLYSGVGKFDRCRGFSIIICVLTYYMRLLWASSRRESARYLITWDRCRKNIASLVFHVSHSSTGRLKNLHDHIFSRKPNSSIQTRQTIPQWLGVLVGTLRLCYLQLFVWFFLVWWSYSLNRNELYPTVPTPSVELLRRINMCEASIQYYRVSHSLVSRKCLSLSLFLLLLLLSCYLPTLFDHPPFQESIGVIYDSYLDPQAAA